VAKHPGFLAQPDLLAHRRRFLAWVSLGALRPQWSSSECSSPCQGEGRRFKSGLGRRDFPEELWLHLGSRTGEVAQLAEHATENRGVGSSILPLATKTSLGSAWTIGSPRMAEEVTQEAELANPSSEPDIFAPSKNLRTSSAR
jgi:hypothetical protein